MNSVAKNQDSSKNTELKIETNLEVINA